MLDDESIEEDYNDEPSEDDYIITPAGPLGAYSAVSQYGRFLGRFNDDEAAEEFIRRHAHQEKVYPTVWKLSDHGNYHVVIDFRYD